MSDLTTQAFNIRRTQNHFYEFKVTGLLPNTVHTITIEDEDWGYATKQRGKDFGAPLVSDGDGCLFVGILYEVPFDREQNFELPRTNALQFQTAQLGSTSRQSTQTVVNNRVIEFSNSNGTSKAQLILPFNTVLTEGPVQTLYPIE